MLTVTLLSHCPRWSPSQSFGPVCSMYFYKQWNGFLIMNKFIVTKSHNVKVHNNLQIISRPLRAQTIMNMNIHTWDFMYFVCMAKKEKVVSSAKMKSPDRMQSNLDTMRFLLYSFFEKKIINIHFDSDINQHKWYLQSVCQHRKQSRNWGSGTDLSWYHRGCLVKAWVHRVKVFIQ